ncbi:VRR-NUC domain-containing protein [Candidatus Pacearchaeota archaeon]|nr:VRR-NUC domain-containing protein [Candidatus Pacearchaeota archaeon]
MYAIPNGGLRNKVVAAKLKREGVKAGVPDVCLPVRSQCGTYIGLYIEMKAKGGRVRSNQKDWLEALAVAGHKTVVCWNWTEARTVIEQYLDIGG